MEIHLISFGDKKYDLRMKDFEIVARASCFFDKITMFRYEELDSKFRNQFYKVLNSTRAGGFIWKPYIIKKTLQEMNIGDILVYCDAGCHINNVGKVRFKQYVDFLNQSEQGVLAFQLPHKEYEYTKKEVFDYFESSGAIKESNQLIATVILLKKCDYSVQLVDHWYNAVVDRSDLFTDEMDKTIQHPDFVEHRHDQSIWSIILKTYGAGFIPDETYFDDFEKQGAAFPLWAARIRPID